MKSELHYIFNCIINLTIIEKKSNHIRSATEPNPSLFAQEQ